MHLIGTALLLCQQPGLFLVDVLVGPIRERHHFAHRLVELALLVQPGNGLAAGDKIRQQCGFGAGFGQAIVEAPGEEAGATAGNIDDLAHHV